MHVIIYGEVNGEEVRETVLDWIKIEDRLI
jgi:hypothetical protein